jgi:hypothetical protein
MIYTVIYLDYKNDLKSEVTDGPMDRPKAWNNMKQEYGTVLAMVPGAHPVHTSGSMEQQD